MKKILVPTDFSAPAMEAYKFAMDLAAKDNAEVLLIHALAVPTLYIAGFAAEPLIYDPVYAPRIAEAKKKLHKMERQAGARSVTVTTDVVFGSLLSSLKQSIEASGADLVVMGTSGSSGFSEIFIGSNTEKVVRFSPIPVLAVRKAVDTRSIKNILLPSPLDLDQVDFIDHVKSLQQFFGATLHTLFINTPANFWRDIEANHKLKQFAQHYRLTDYKLHFRNYFHEEDGIVDFAYRQNMDLVAMATHARKGLEHLFNLSVTEEVVNHIECPVWTYRIQK